MKKILYLKGCKNKFNRSKKRSNNKKYYQKNLEIKYKKL